MTLKTGDGLNSFKMPSTELVAAFLRSVSPGLRISGKKKIEDTSPTPIMAH